MRDYSSNERTVGFILEDKASRLNDKICIYYGSEQVSYRELNERSTKIAAGLQELGVQKGDHIALMLDNCMDFIYAIFGVIKTGAVEIPINTHLRANFLRHVLDDSDSIVLIVDQKYLPAISRIVDGLKRLQKIIVYPTVPKINPIKNSGCELISFEKLMLTTNTFRQPLLKLSDTFKIMYTSGTTGKAKGAMISHNFAVFGCTEKAKHLRTTSDDIIYNCYPLYNGTGQLETMWTAFMAEGAVAHSNRFSASRFWDEIRFYNATEFVYMGGILSILLKQPESAQDRNHRVRAAYGLPTPKDIYQVFQERFNVKLIEPYGSTEANLVTYQPYDAPRAGSCGKVVPGYDVRIFNDDDDELPPGEVGEIVVRPLAPFIMMSGYYKQPEITLQTYRNLWYHTGDLGFQDADGYFYFMRRKKEVIRNKGYMVSAWELEQAINQHPNVLESAAVGIPSELGEEEIKLCVIPNCPELTELKLYEFCLENLPRYMLPRYIEFKQDFARTPTLKIEKFHLTTEGITTYTWDALLQSAPMPSHGMVNRRVDVHTPANLGEV